MNILPILTHKIVEIIFKNTTLTNEQLEEILSCEKTTLTQDLLSIIQFCSDELGELEDEISCNLLYYSLFLLKEKETENHLNIILDILKWDDDKIDHWFGDSFTEYYWCLVYHFGKQHIERLVEFLKEEEIEIFAKEQVALALCQTYIKNPEKQNNISTLWTELLQFYNTIPENNESIDHTYLAFFTSYILQPTEYQKELIKSLYDKELIDLSVNGGYDKLFDIIESERKCISIFDLNNEFIQFENRPKMDYNSKIFEDFSKYKSTPMPIIVEKKMARNDLCFCGSGKKYKKCCLNSIP